MKDLLYNTSHMGLYINIAQTYPCPKCKRMLSGWQTKDLSYDGYPVEILMQKYKLNKKMTGEIYTNCDTCGFVEYMYTKGKLQPISSS